jgi:hypothetical protein
MAGGGGPGNQSLLHGRKLVIRFVVRIECTHWGYDRLLCGVN